MKPRIFGLWTLGALALLVVAYLGYDGFRGRPAVHMVGGRVIAEYSGRSEPGKPSATPPISCSDFWAADVTLTGDFSGVFAVKVAIPTPGQEMLDDKALGQVATGQGRIYAPGSPTTFSHTFNDGVPIILVFVGDGTWAAAVRY